MSEERGEQLNHGYLCQPFTSKGHFHLPSGIAPVIMDTSARHHLATRPDNSVLFLPHSWNINGKPITDRALEELTGKTKKRAS